MRGGCPLTRTGRLSGLIATVAAVALGLAAALAVTGTRNSGADAPPPGDRPAGSPSTPPPAPHDVHFGLTVPGADPGVELRVARQLGTNPDLFGMFIKLNSAFTSADITRRSGATGMTPLITLEPWRWQSVGADHPKFSLAAIIRGDHDAAFTRIAANMHRYGKPVYLRFAHEMNGRWYPWAEAVNGNRAGEYVTAWRHVHDIFDRQQATNVRWIWAPNVVQQLGPDAPSLASLYPGDAYVDYVGLTGYGHEPTAAATYDQTITLLEALTDKPIVLAEIGAAGATKTAWINSFGPWLNTQPRVIAFNWFNTDPRSVAGATGDYRLNDTPGRLLAFRHMLTVVGLAKR